MLVKIWLYLTKAVITGDVDEVRVQSEEPNLKSLLSSRLFAFLRATLPCGRTSKVLAGPFVSLIPALTIPCRERQRVSFLSLCHRLTERRFVEGA